MTRTVEHLAPATIAELLPKLTRLSADQPTTAEIEEAILVGRAITRALFEWAAFRYSNHAKTQVMAIPTETPEEKEELDRIERSHPTVSHPKERISA